jgi:hypothetical protein
MYVREPQETHNLHSESFNIDQYFVFLTYFWISVYSLACIHMREMLVLN